MQRVLARAQLREARRQEALRQVVQGQPEAPKGLLATFKKEAHGQAVVAWEQARKAASRLALQAKRLVERLRDAARPERARAWVHAMVQTPSGQRQDRATPTELAVPDERQPEPGKTVRPAPQRAELVLEGEAANVPLLIEKSKTRPLTLPEKQQLARGLNATAKLIDDGYRPAPAQYRQSVEAARQRAHRQVAADMFLNLPRDEALQRYPALARHYAVLEAVDRHGDARIRTPLQQGQEFRQAQQRIAAAIEQGEAVQFKAGRLEVVPRRVIGQPQAESELSKDRDRER